MDGQIPGDRATDCWKTMYPIAYEIKNGWMKIQFQCKACGKLHRNKRADDDEVENLDDYIKQYKEMLY